MISSGRGSLADVPEQVWLQRGQANALATFRRAARTVPAYRAFLKEHGIRPKDIQTYADFQQLPTTSKENYLLKHDLADLMPGGKLDGTCVVSVSSGYSGEPILWPRSKRQDDGAVRGMQALYSLFDVSRKSTLVLNAFSLGPHVGGQMCTDLSLRVARLPGSQITVATPGASIEDTLELVKHMSPRFDQTIIWSYPSLVHKIVVSGAESGIHWGELNTFAICGGEGFSEGWRRFMVDRLGGPSHPMRVCALYGSADGGLMGFDTPLSLLTRSLAHDRQDLRHQLFGGQPPLAFVQFNPIGRFFESVDGELALTCWQAVPMVRYQLHDVGDVIPFSALLEHISHCAADEPAVAGNSVSMEQAWRWPFLSCFGRSDGTVSVVGTNVYPHYLQHVFARHREVSHFKLSVEEDTASQSRLTIWAEWADGEPSEETASRVAQTLHNEVLKALLDASSDYRESYRDDPTTAEPRIVMVAHGTGPFAADLGRWKRSYVHRAEPGDPCGGDA